MLPQLEKRVSSCICRTKNSFLCFGVAEALLFMLLCIVRLNLYWKEITTVLHRLKHIQKFYLLNSLMCVCTIIFKCMKNDLPPFIKTKKVRFLNTLKIWTHQRSRSKYDELSWSSFSSVVGWLGVWFPAPEVGRNVFGEAQMNIIDINYWFFLSKASEN